MNRRTFIASLIGIPAALKALVSAKPMEPPIIRPGDYPYAGPRVWCALDPGVPNGKLVMFSTPSGPMSHHERMWMNNREQHLWATHCHSPAYEKALEDIARRNPGCFERLRSEERRVGKECRL